jgi:molecular chaperone HscB
LNNWKLQRNYFEIFGLSVDFNLNKKELTKSFRQLMRKLHPDLFAHKNEVFFFS